MGGSRLIEVAATAGLTVLVYRFIVILLNFLVTVKVAPHECITRSGLL